MAAGTTDIGTGALHLRGAGASDLSLLLRWQQQSHVVASGAANDDWEWETELRRRPAWREQLIAELDGRPIGFLQIIDPALEDSHYWGQVSKGLRAVDIWIGEIDDLGRGYGTAMMRLALSRCFTDPRVSAVLVDPLVSNHRAHRFYRRLGFETVERRRFGEDDCLVLRLDRDCYLHDLSGRRGGAGPPDR